MSTFTGYSNKASAVRGLTRHLGAALRNRPDFDLNSLIEQVDGRYRFYADKADAAVGLAETTEEDENLILFCGHSHCPSCEIHLANGVTDFDGMVDTHGSEKEALKHMKHQFMCLGCNAEWGDEIKPAKGKGRKEPTRHYSNRSTVEGAVNVSHEIYNSMPEARRKDAIAAAVEAGVTFYTARTQYQKWYKARQAK